MEYLILAVIIIVIYLWRRKRNRAVEKISKYEEILLAVQNDNKSKIDENTTIISCKNSDCKQSIIIPIIEKRLYITCPLCHKLMCYPDTIEEDKKKIFKTIQSIDNNYSAYLDIETTSIKPSNGKLTVIGLYLESDNDHRFIQLVGDEISPSKLKEIMKEVRILYTYNGKRFDLPYIRAKLGEDLERYCIHRDMMYDCWKKNLYGGFKEVERKLDIKRPQHLISINGESAVELWWRYEAYGDKNALFNLLEYNKVDVCNLRILRQKLNI